MRHLGLGLKVAFGDRRLRPFIFGPLAFSVFLYLMLLIGGFWLIVPRMGVWMDSIGGPSWLGTGLGAMIWGVLWWFLSGPIFLSLMSMTSIPLWDPLSRRVEEIRTGSRGGPGPSVGIIIVDTFFRIVFAAFLIILVLVFGHFGFGLVGAGLAGILGLMDFTSPALSRRGHLLPTQFGAVFRLKGAFTFWLGIAAVSLLPFLHAFLCPAWVTAGTLMVLESETNSPSLS